MESYTSVSIAAPHAATRKLAPGPNGIPVLGQTLMALKDPLTLFMGAWRDHGDLVTLHVGGHRLLLINSPDAVRRVLVDNRRNYKKVVHGLKLVLGEGLITSDGELWRRQRRLAQPAFNRDRLERFASLMAADTMSMLSDWESRGEEPFDIHREMMKLTFRIVARALVSTDVQSAADRVGQALSVALGRANSYASAPIRLPSWLPTPGNRRFHNALRALDELVFGIIAARRRCHEEIPDLLSTLMATRDEVTGAQMSDQQLRDEVMTLLMAGHETTANALTWTFYLLSQHPAVENRLREEIQTVLRGRAPMTKDLPLLPYNRMVVEESMRLYPPVWAFSREATEDDCLAGFHVPARTIVKICPYILHRHPALWTNPEGFFPERFEALREEERSRMSYLPFGAGQRHCIGSGFAMLEAQIVLASVLGKYRLELDPCRPVALDPGVTLRPRSGVWMRRRSAGCH